MKKILSLITVIVLAITLVGCGSKGKEFNFQEGYITIGLEADYAPFNWRETTANDYNVKLHGRNDYVAGYDVEIAKAIAEDLGLELRIKMVGWDALIPSLGSNQIDLIIAGMSPTKKRMRSISFTDLYYTSTHVAVVKKDGLLASVESLDELKSFRGIGQMGTLYADIVKDLSVSHGSIELPQLKTVPLIINAIKTGAADFTIVEEPVANGIVAKDSSLKIILKSDNNIFNVADEDREVAIGLRKVDDILREKINATLSKITETERNLLMEKAVERAA